MLSEGRAAKPSEVGQRPIGWREAALLHGCSNVPHGRRQLKPEFESVIPKLGWSRHLDERF